MVFAVERPEGVDALESSWPQGIDQVHTCPGVKKGQATHFGVAGRDRHGVGSKC